MHCVCCALRSFIRFLRMEGHAMAPQLENFPHPRIYRQEEIPSFLNSQQVKNVLDCVDRSTTAGIRDYAVLLLLLTYGMRASEVTRLTLEDIDWSAEKIHLRDRKSGRSDIMPLSAIVGEALYNGPINSDRKKRGFKLDRIWSI